MTPGTSHPSVKVGLSTFFAASCLLLYQELTRPVPLTLTRYVNVVEAEDGNPQLLLEISFPLVALVVISLLAIAWRFRERVPARLLNWNLVAISLAMLYWLDGRAGARAKLAMDTAEARWTEGKQLEAIGKLIDAVDKKPGDPFLAVRLHWMLVAANQREEAEKWGKTVDKMKIPEYLLPTLQEARLALRHAASRSGPGGKQ